ncbi:hypothetical protein MKW92_045340 [Papaver armeniacum]|nr:hypothetical protein MKW92_045340 [Papaver armeniacum]
MAMEAIVSIVMMVERVATQPSLPELRGRGDKSTNDLETQTERIKERVEVYTSTIWLFLSSSYEALNIVPSTE